MYKKMDVRLHSKIKHLIIGYYFGIFKNFLSDKGPLYSLYYADLFAGDGKCTCSQMPDEFVEYYPADCPKEWPPPYFSLMRYARERKFKLRCIFNDLNSDHVTALREATAEYSEFISDIANEDANQYYKKALNLIGDPSKPSLFFLDPTNHDHLPFSTIEGISSFEDAQKGRKPELIINLMTYSMLEGVTRGRQKDYDSITKSLGTDTWLEKLADYKAVQKTHELFRDAFVWKLRSLGYFTTDYLIKSTKVRSPVFYLVFATSQKKTYEVHKDMKEPVEKIMAENWVARNFEVYKMLEKKKQGYKFIWEY